VVFLDTVGSTRIAAELGDERWQVLLRRELAVLRHLLKERGGREVDAAGDGLFVLFREPAQGVRFAADAALAVRELGLETRAGVHFGETEFAEGHPGGIVVHTGARTMSTGGPGEVIVTQTVRDLVSGGNLRFAEHGVHELKGVPGTWPLFRLVGIDGQSLAPPLAEKWPLRGGRRRPAAAGGSASDVDRRGGCGAHRELHRNVPAHPRRTDSRIYLRHQSLDPVRSRDRRLDGGAVRPASIGR
jgi:hypothetical protein